MVIYEYKNSVSVSNLQLHEDVFDLLQLTLLRATKGFSPGFKMKLLSYR